MNYTVRFSPRAKAQLQTLYSVIANEASAQIADNYTDRLVDHCQQLAIFPKRGTPRDDLRPEIRTIVFRRRVTIAYDVPDPIVNILGIFYGGQNIDDAWDKE